MILSVENLSVAYDSGVLFSDVSVKASEGQVIALVGRNGTGKSTFLRCILGLQKPRSGRILADGEDVGIMPLKRRAECFSYVSTYAADVAYLTSRDVVAMGCNGMSRWDGVLSGREEEIVENALLAVSASDLAGRFLSTLSDGERQRIMIARAVAQGSPIMVLDEPTAFLDVPNRIRIHSLLRSLAKESGKIILFSTHEIALARKFADCFWLMDGGGVVSFPASENLLPEEFSI